MTGFPQTVSLSPGSESLTARTISLFQRGRRPKLCLGRNGRRLPRQRDLQERHVQFARDLHGHRLRAGRRDNYLLSNTAARHDHRDADSADGHPCACIPEYACRPGARLHCGRRPELCLGRNGWRLRNGRHAKSHLQHAGRLRRYRSTRRPAGRTLNRIPRRTLMPFTLTRPSQVRSAPRAGRTRLSATRSPRTPTPTSFGAAGLPSGLSINSATGQISGTPSVAGTFAVALTTANAGASGDATLNLTIAQTYTLAIGASPGAGGSGNGAGSIPPAPRSPYPKRPPAATGRAVGAARIQDQSPRPAIRPPRLR